MTEGSLSIAADILSVVGVLATLYGLWRGGPWVVMRLRNKHKSSGGNSLSQSTVRDSLFIGGNATVSAELLEKFVGRKSPSDALPSGPPGDEAALAKELKDQLAENAGISETLLTASQLAALRGDKQMLDWITAEMDGYPVDGGSVEPNNDNAHRCIEGYFFANGAGDARFPMKLFEPKPADKVEAAVRTTREKGPLFVPTKMVDTPADVRRFFSKDAPPGVTVGEQVEFIVDPSALELVLSGIRRRLRGYLREIGAK